MDFKTWAAKHNISAEALSELEEIVGSDAPETHLEYVDEMNELSVSTNCRIYATRLGWRIFRNNVGAYSEKHPPTPGTRWGLANDSSKMNKIIKSSDLIGIRPVVITPEHVGKTIGQFVAIEVKRPFWKYTGTAREVAQLSFIKLITKLGGHAKFVSHSGGIQ